MLSSNKFEIKYLGDMGYVSTRKPAKRSVRRKLFIVLCFLGILTFLPIISLGLSNIKFQNQEKITQSDIPIFENKKTVNQNTTSDTNSTNSIKNETVINNDSYWKITKRACGNGQNYLSVRDQNSGKALYEGDKVTVNCSL